MFRGSSSSNFEKKTPARGRLSSSSAHDGKGNVRPVPLSGAENRARKDTSPEPTILVVEDDEDFSFLLCDRLSEAEMNPVPAGSLAEARRRIDLVNPDAVILDLMLPDGDGLDLLLQIRNQPKTSRIPVIVVSGIADDPTVQRGLDSGADAYLVKPTPFDKIVATLQKLLSPQDSSPWLN